MDDAQLHTVWQQRQSRSQPVPLGPSLTFLMKHTLAKRVHRLSKLAEIWDDVIPEPIREHTALESFHRGVLTVVVDSAAQRFHLQTLLTGGLMKEIQARFAGALNKVRLVPGQFYSVDFNGARRYEF
jgi:hypothetical protein